MRSIGRPEVFTLSGVAHWPVAVAFVIAYTALRYIGDPPVAGAELGAYAFGVIAPPVILAALLTLENVVLSLAGVHVAGPVVALFIAASALASQLLVAPSGSVLAEYWQTEPIIAMSTETVFMSMMWILIAAAGISISTFRGQSTQLEARAAELEAELSALRDRTAKEDERTIAAISSIVTRTTEDLTSRHHDEVSAALRSWSDRVVRPMSHQIAADSHALVLPPSPRLASQWIVAADKVTSRDPLPPLLLGAIALGGTPGLLFRSYPPLIAFVSWIVIVAYTVVATVGVNYVTRPLLPPLRMRWRMVLMYAATLPLVVGEFTLFRLPSLLGVDAPQSDQAMSALWIGIITSPFLALLTIWIRVLREAGDETIELRESRARDLAIEVARQNISSRQRRAAWAQALHGPVQSAMVAASIRLDRAQQAGVLDDAAVEQACQPVWEALEAAASATADAPEWDQGTSRLHALWDDLIVLDIDVDPSCRDVVVERGTCRAVLLEVLTEAVSNAVRHGRAHEVVATIRPASTATVALVISDDGEAIDVSRPAGLGSTLLDEVSIEWTRSRQGNTNMLSIELPALES